MCALPRTRRSSHPLGTRPAAAGGDPKVDLQSRSFKRQSDRRVLWPVSPDAEAGPSFIGAGARRSLVSAIPTLRADGQPLLHCRQKTLLSHLSRSARQCPPPRRRILQREMHGLSPRASQVRSALQTCTAAGLSPVPHAAVQPDAVPLLYRPPYSRILSRGRWAASKTVRELTFSASRLSITE